MTPIDRRDDLQVTVHSPASPARRPFHLMTTIIRDVVVWRELTWILFRRDLKAQFRQSIMGYAWLIFPPLANTLVWYLLNRQKLINVESGEIPYVVFVLVGSTLWTAFGATVMAPSETISANKQVFTKLNVPLESFILAGAARAIFNFLIASLIIVPIILIQGIGFGWTAILFPVGVMSMLTLAFTLGMLIAPLGAFYSDFRNALGPLLAVLMFTAPVVFPIPKNDGLIATVMEHNPITPSLSLSRDMLFSGSFEWLPSALMWFAITLALLLATMVTLRVAKPHIIERMGM